MAHSLVVADKIFPCDTRTIKIKDVAGYAEEQSTFEAKALLRDAFINYKHTQPSLRARTPQQPINSSGDNGRGTNNHNFWVQPPCRHLPTKRDVDESRVPQVR